MQVPIHSRLEGTQPFSPLTHLNEDVDNDERNKEREKPAKLCKIVSNSSNVQWREEEAKKFVELSKRLPAEDRSGDSIKKKKFAEPEEERRFVEPEEERRFAGL